MELKQTKTRIMDSFVSRSKEEEKKFRKTGKIIYLQQAGNKLYNAHIYMLEALERIEIRNNATVYEIGSMWAKKDKNIWQLRRNVFALHKWFYEGIADAEIADEITRETFVLFSKVKKKRLKR